MWAIWPHLWLLSVVLSLQDPAMKMQRAQVLQDHPEADANVKTTLEKAYIALLPQALAAFVIALGQLDTNDLIMVVKTQLLAPRSNVWNLKDFQKLAEIELACHASLPSQPVGSMAFWCGCVADD
jgi:hypothetical protein